MSRRSIIKKYQVLTSADSATNPNSTQTDVSGVDFITYQINIAALVNANLVVNFSNNDTFAQSEVIALDFAQTTPLLGSTDTEYIVHIENKGFKWLQISVANNGGTGVVNAWVSGTVRGA